MDITNQAALKYIIQEIEGDENKRRKADHVKRQDVFNDHQRQYVLKMLENEFSKATVQDMRTMTSINLTRKIISEMASIYKRAPERNFTECSEEQIAGIEKLYQEAKVNVKLKKTNQKYKLHDQCTIQILPHDGKIGLKLLAPHQYDVIPDPTNPEKAMAYIISAASVYELNQDNTGASDIQGNYYGSKNEYKSDGTNQKIADADDNNGENKNYIVWTADVNLVCDKNGAIIELNPNPIGMLPFIDVSAEKDFEFWVKRGSSVVDFALDFSLVNSDLVNTSRLQSYAQPVIIAEKVPENLIVGPNNILFLPIDPTRPEATPKFEFATPNPDLQASLVLQDKLVSYFLTSQSIDPKSIASSGDGKTYSSALERMLALVEKFEASQDDIDLFCHVEEEVFEIMKAWYSVLQGTSMLDPEYDFGVWPEASEIYVNYSTPQLLETKKDVEESVIKLLENGLITKLDALMRIHGVDEPKAKEMLAQIELENNQNIQPQ